MPLTFSYAAPLGRRRFSQAGFRSGAVDLDWDFIRKL
jgi:hypothetical protein